MRYFTTAAFWTVFSSSVDAFLPLANIQYQHVTTTQLGSTLSKPASSREEDLMLTLQVVLDHADRSSTASSEQYIQQVEKSRNESDIEVAVDVSIPYMATAKLAYERSDKSNSYEEFETKYLTDAVQEVISKQPVDVSIDYMATAKLAYEQSNKSNSYKEFETKYLADAVQDVISKQPVDVSIDYMATAKVAYEQSDKSNSYKEFETKYLADAVQDVISKQPFDVSIDYMATAKLAYEQSDKSTPYKKFETKYLADAVTDVIAKKEE